MKYAAGDHVRLNSGGPEMVVVLVRPGDAGRELVTCGWSDSEGLGRQQTFDSMMLRSANGLWGRVARV